jgi:GxxExxY protein
MRNTLPYFPGSGLKKLKIGLHALDLPHLPHLPVQNGSNGSRFSLPVLPGLPVQNALAWTSLRSGPRTHLLPLLGVHRNYATADGLSHTAIGAAIEVHKELGPGLLEEIYKQCLIRELTLRGLHVASELMVPVRYKGAVVHGSLRLDVFVDGCLIIETKAVQSLLPIHQAQLLSYMKVLDVPVGVLINFNEIILKTGIRRLTLRGCGRP